MIDTIMEKYLVESKKKEALDKVIKVIKSCKTEDQLKTALKMADNYSRKYPTFFQEMLDLWNYKYPDPILSKKLNDILIQKFKEIKLEQKWKSKKEVFD